MKKIQMSKKVTVVESQKLDFNEDFFLILETNFVNGIKKKTNISAQPKNGEYDSMVFMLNGQDFKKAKELGFHTLVEEDQVISGEEIFQMALAEKISPSLTLAFYSNWDGAVYLPANQKTYKSLVLDYGEAELSDQYYDLKKVKTLLEEKKIAKNLKIESIPSYNSFAGSYSLQINLWLEVEAGSSDRDTIEAWKKEIGIEAFRKSDKEIESFNSHSEYDDLNS